MSKLRVLSARGDTVLEWDERKLHTGDPEALAAVREAERIFEEQRSRGATAFKVEPEKPAPRQQPKKQSRSQRKKGGGGGGNKPPGGGPRNQ